MIKIYSAQKQAQLSERESALALTKTLNERAGVLLQTCNRIEFYEGDGFADHDTVRHLFRVVSGIESNLIGEVAIQGQVKNAYLQASGKYKLSSGLHFLFQRALNVGKRVRTESLISRGAMSHSQAAVEIICKSGIDLNHALITIIGAHKLNEDIIRFLRSKGAETIFIGNKSFEKAQVIANKYDCKTFRFDQITEFLSYTNILISATSAPHVIIEEKVFPKNKEMLVLDLAFPRDIDAKIGELPGVQLYNLETIEQTVDQNIELRRFQVIKAEQIIEEEVEKYFLKQFKNVTV
jgi:glutamyl-tRNA reductase